MNLNKKNIGFAITGSFCTFDSIFLEMESLIKKEANIYSIFSTNAQDIDTRFGEAETFLQRAKSITGKDPITSIVDAEILGPNQMLDLLVIAPCSGNTLAKLAQGITDTPVLMAAKGHLRNNKPLVISISTNDGLGLNMKNIGLLMNTKNIYFVPFGQDNYINKPKSIIAKVELLEKTIEHALDHMQYQPVIQSPHQ